MRYRKLGKHGIKVSEISLGAWLTYGGTVEDQTAINCIHTALDNKINFIDAADIYAKGGAEKVVGKALEGETYQRKDFVVSSKVFWPMSENVNDWGLSRKHIHDSIDGTLDRLNLDYLDIYFAHRFDSVTPLEETVEAMDDLVRDGRVRYWGTSVWSAAQLERAVGIAKEIGATPPSVEQPRYNMLDRHIELDVMETTKYHGMGIVPWSPLAGGILTGKYNEGIPEGSRATTSEFMKRYLDDKQLMEKVNKVTEFAKNKGVEPGQLALAWALLRPEVSSLITGATKPEHVLSNIKALEIELSKDEVTQLEEILDNKPEKHMLYNHALPDHFKPYL